MTMIHTTELAQALIRQKSITAERDHGALALLERTLSAMGFTCWRLPFSGDGSYAVDNLFARLEKPGLTKAAMHFCFAGHTDVVPPGSTPWALDPFAGEIVDIQLLDPNDKRMDHKVLLGRGACDMKAAIAAMVSATSRFLASPFIGSISFMLTGDEEGDATNGTPKMLEWLKAQPFAKPNACLVGEPTSAETLGDTVKIGRRGSVSFELTVKGVQGHVAYPERADNPIPKLVEILHRLKAVTLDTGNDYFPPSNLEITTIDVGNAAGNVIPDAATAKFNIRFSPTQSREKLVKWVRSTCESVTSQFLLKPSGTAEAFLTQPGALSQWACEAVKEITGRMPQLSTSGGTSDARFIKALCPVVELGLLNRTAHHTNEHVAVSEIESLSLIYERILRRAFA